MCVLDLRMFDESSSSPQIQQFQQPGMHLACLAWGPQHGELGGLFKTFISIWSLPLPL